MEKSIQKQNPSRARSRDFSTRLPFSVAGLLRRMKRLARNDPLNCFLQSILSFGFYKESVFGGLLFCRMRSARSGNSFRMSVRAARSNIDTVSN